MHLSKLRIENFRCFGDGSAAFELSLKPGLTALVGENDSGKTAVVDALRFVLGTTDQEWNRVESTDFHEASTSREIKIQCEFSQLSASEKTAFVEYLTYGTAGGEPVLHVTWSAKDTGEQRHGRPYRRVEVRSGKNGDGPVFVQEVRDLLRATYLRPLRDAEGALSAGRGSRLSEILHHNEGIKAGGKFDEAQGIENLDGTALKDFSVLGIGDLANALLQQQKGVVDTRKKIDDHLDQLTLAGENITSNVKVSGTTASDDIRLRQLLEKLDLSLGGTGKLGLGSNNLLFMACELLLLIEDGARMKLLLIEEPEAHLHAQRQLRVMKYMQERAKDKGVQIIVTTHSPALASAIELPNMVIIHGNRGYSLASEKTNLEASDYRFLARFLDSTKANLFFAKAVMIVEGDAESILMPAIAALIDRDFTGRGVSIVNVGGVGLRRYARIFQRKDIAAGIPDYPLHIPVACVTDMDVQPDCAPVVLGAVAAGAQWPALRDRRWRAKKDFNLTERRAALQKKADGQSVRTFVSDEWTLEYDLALGPKAANGGYSGGLAEDVYIAARLAEEDDAINEQRKARANIVAAATAEFAQMKADAVAAEGSTKEEVLATRVHSKFVNKGVSKAIAAQYLSERLQERRTAGTLTAEQLRACLPKYLVDAIEYVTVVRERAPAAPAAAAAAPAPSAAPAPAPTAVPPAI